MKDGLRGPLFKMTTSAQENELTNQSATVDSKLT